VFHSPPCRNSFVATGCAASPGTGRRGTRASCRAACRAGSSRTRPRTVGVTPTSVVACAAPGARDERRVIGDVVDRTAAPRDRAWIRAMIRAIRQKHGRGGVEVPRLHDSRRAGTARSARARGPRVVADDPRYPVLEGRASAALIVACNSDLSASTANCFGSSGAVQGRGQRVEAGALPPRGPRCRGRERAFLGEVCRPRANRKVVNHRRGAAVLASPPARLRSPCA